MNENDRKLARLRATLEARGDGKCYFPCYDCRGLQNRRLLITTPKNIVGRRGTPKGVMNIVPW
jgi:hypothetical protein